jgi:hypothetical protein
MTRARPYAPALLFDVLAAATAVSGCSPSGAVSPGAAPSMPTVTVVRLEKSVLVFVTVGPIVALGALASTGVKALLKA